MSYAERERSGSAGSHHLSTKRGGRDRGWKGEWRGGEKERSGRTISAMFELSVAMAGLSAQVCASEFPDFPSGLSKESGTCGMARNGRQVIKSYANSAFHLSQVECGVE